MSTDIAPVWLCHGAGVDADHFVQKGAVSVPCALDNGRVDLRAALCAMAERGVTRVFCEGGGALAASLLKARLVDRLEVFQAGKVIGADGTAAVAGMDVVALDAAAQFTCAAHRHIGADTWTSWDAPENSISVACTRLIRSGRAARRAQGRPRSSVRPHPA